MKMFNEVDYFDEINLKVSYKAVEKFVTLSEDKELSEEEVKSYREKIAKSIESVKESKWYRYQERDDEVGHPGWAAIKIEHNGCNLVAIVNLCDINEDYRGKTVVTIITENMFKSIWDDARKGISSKTVLYDPDVIDGEEAVETAEEEDTSDTVEILAVQRLENDEKFIKQAKEKLEFCKRQMGTLQERIKKLEVFIETAEEDKKKFSTTA